MILSLLPQQHARNMWKNKSTTALYSYLITLAIASNHHRLIIKLMKIPGLCAVAEVRGVEGE